MESLMHPDRDPNPLGQVFISIVAGGLSYYVMEKVIGDQLYSPIGPTILVIILSWFTANMFCEARC